ncbi:hypothetical protein OUY22_23855 [Nonomuraea sp. MCN248]|uniref:Uncharacterized protein n=1 Tax=Nonomuraea corallina TaxID=2989783 RepID=A0ABT4SGY4_9ACTN|nr:hypothetical protein [Nonomuraea corallina]MDA0636463.1 hypothetical protein [Nonomuraea corallina]
MFGRPSGVDSSTRRLVDDGTALTARGDGRGADEHEASHPGRDARGVQGGRRQMIDLVEERVGPPELHVSRDVHDRVGLPQLGEPVRRRRAGPAQLGEVAGHGFGAGRTYALAAGVRSGQRRDVMSLGHEAAHESAADETAAAGDEDLHVFTRGD